MFFLTNCRGTPTVQMGTQIHDHEDVNSGNGIDTALILVWPVQYRYAICISEVSVSEDITIKINHNKFQYISNTCLMHIGYCPDQQEPNKAYLTLSPDSPYGYCPDQQGLEV